MPESNEPHGVLPPNQPDNSGLVDAVVTSAPIVLFATDAAGVITMSRGKALEALGLREGELVGRSVFDLYVTEPAVADAARRALRGEDVTARLDLDGTIHETRFSPRWVSGTVVGVVGVATDITEREQAEATLRYQATHSPATGLPNRSFFVQQVNESVATARGHTTPVTVMVVLLDRFQEVSETFGYAVGTQILRDSAERLREVTSEHDGLGALEPGKFGVVIPQSSRTARERAARLREVLAAPFVVEEREISLSVHVGIATFPGHGDDAELLLRAAEQAARTATALRYPYAIHQPQTTDLSRNFTLLADLRVALATGGLRIEYQPLIGLRSLAMESVEALARWDHPRYGAIAPREFVGLADRAGLLPRITEFVLESAVRHLYVWEQEGLRPRVAVNVSPAEVLSPQVEDVIRPTLETWGIGLDRLTIEVTEDQQLGEVTPAQSDVLGGLTADGMHLAIDDFGTGYSNISSLHALPWTHLKVDQSLVARLGADARSDELVRAVVSLGHAFGWRVVAEGVETPAQWDKLMEVGCDLVQGFHVTRPLPPEALSAFLRESPWTLP